MRSLKTSFTETQPANCPFDMVYVEGGRFDMGSEDKGVCMRFFLYLQQNRRCVFRRGMCKG